jgi:hypothetical protein
MAFLQQDDADLRGANVVVVQQRNGITVNVTDTSPEQPYFVS